MGSDNRRTIDDLIARYQFEKDLDDIYVEGLFDKEVLSVSASPGNSRVAYEISTVDIPLSLLEKHKLTEGNKQRVIALTRELANAVPDCSCIGLVDRDLDHWFGELESTKGLRWTTYCSMEMHFLNEECVDNILRVTAGIKVQNISTLLKSVVTVLAQLYAMRLATREMSLKIHWPAIKKHLSRNGDVIEFDSSEFSQNALISSGNGKHRASFQSCASEYIKRFSSDPRLHCHGHDYVQVLAWTVREFKGIPDYASEQSIERLFVLLARMSPSVRQEIWATLSP